MKRLVSLFIAILLSVSCAACSSNPDIPENDGTDIAYAEDPSAEETNESQIPPSNLPDMNFDGAVYRISCYSDNDTHQLFSEDLDGEAVNDAIYQRNSKLMEKYNYTLKVQLDSSDGDYNSHGALIEKCVKSGDDAFELIYGHVVGSCNSAIAGMYLDLYDIPYLDFTRQWWPQQSVEEMTVYGKMFTICCNATYGQLASAKVIYFNKDTLNDYNLETPYDLVRDGAWTISKLIEQTRGLYTDLNGDGKRDPDDFYGYTTYPSQNGFLVSCNTPVLSPSEDGGREITVMTERTVSLVEMVHDWYYETDDCLLRDAGDVYTAFGTGHAAYGFSKLEIANSHYRYDEISYGIVPQPKFDEAQDKYYVFACPSLFSIPLCCMNTDFAGFILEAMTYSGYYEITPSYFEITVKEKIADAPDDVEMLTIINDRLTVSFAYCYDNWQGFAHLFNSRMGFNNNSGSKNLASVYEKNVKSAQRRLDTVLKGFADAE